jgi:hypothetical protein
MDMMTVDRFTRFQTAMVTSVPPVKCRLPMYAQDSCYPKFTEKDCHTCGLKYEREMADGNSRI